MKLGVLASHEGTTLQAVLDACAAGAPFEVSLVISNNSGSGALRRAREAGVPALWLSSKTHADADELDRAMVDALASHGVEVLLLAGYMKKLAPRTLAAFRGHIVNTHPALLPKFGGQGMYGIHVHRAVLAAGEAVTGVSIHLVEAEYDSGPVIARSEVAVHAGDTPETLAQRVQQSERALLVEVLTAVGEGRLKLADFS